MPIIFDAFDFLKKKISQKIRTFAIFEIFIYKEKLIIKKSNKIMKSLDFTNESTKNAVINITNDILKLNLPETKTYIKIGDDDELMLDENFTLDRHDGIMADEAKQYLIVYLTDIRIYQDEVENEMDMDYYLNLTDEDGEPLGDDYMESPEYQEEYKSIEEDLIEENTIPYVFDEINKAIEEYNEINK